MRLAVGSDHRGYVVRLHLVELANRLGHEVEEIGPPDSEAADYPDIAAQVATMVSRGVVDRGILVCGTGLGMCIMDNKCPGIRATPCHDDLTAEMSRRHLDANVLCLSADLLGEQLIFRIVKTWLDAPFEGADGGRHARRVEKITQLERKYLCCPRNWSTQFRG